MAESSRGNDKVKKEVEPLLGAVDSFTHGGIRKVLFLVLDSLSLVHTHTHTAFVFRSSFFSHFVCIVVFCRRSLSRKFLRGD
jgi:hypothetical protein